MRVLKRGDMDPMRGRYHEEDMAQGDIQQDYISPEDGTSSKLDVDDVLSLPTTEGEDYSPSTSSTASNVRHREGRRRKAGCYGERFPDRRVIFMLTVMQLMGILFLILVGPVSSVVMTVAWGILSALLYAFVRWAHYAGYDDTLSAGVARGLVMGSLALSILIYYEGTHGAVHEMVANSNGTKKLYDDELLSIDRFFLGWMFPDGQLSIWADGNRFIGPESVLGPFLTEILQIYYAR